MKKGLPIFGLIFLTGFFGVSSFSIGEEENNFPQPIRGDAQVEESIEPVAPFSDSSLKDALGQTLLIGFEGTELTPELLYLMHEIRPGGVLLLRRNLKNGEQTEKLIANLQRVSLQVTGQPLFIAIDQEGEPLTRLEWSELKIAQGKIEDFTEAYRLGRARAQELRELGINMNLAPVLDSLASDDFLFSRSFQRRPQIAVDISKGLVWGHEREGVSVVPKHFPGYDGIPFNPEKEEIPAVEELPNTTLFKSVFKDTHQKFVMLSHVIYTNLDAAHPFPFSLEGMNFLKEELSGEVIVMTDDLTSETILAQYDAAEVGARAIHSGADILLLAGHRNPAVIRELYQGLWKFLGNDEALRKKVMASAEKVLEAKKTLLGDNER